MSMCVFIVSHWGTGMGRLNKLVKRVFRFCQISAPTRCYIRSRPLRPLMSWYCCSTFVLWHTFHKTMRYEIRFNSTNLWTRFAKGTFVH